MSKNMQVSDRFSQSWTTINPVTTHLAWCHVQDSERGITASLTSAGISKRH